MFLNTPVHHGRQNLKGGGGINAIHIKVSLSKNGRKTDTEKIIKKAAKDGITDLSEYLERAIAIFKRQAEIDFFIHKDAGGFLHEQFNAWMYQYLFREESDFSEKRIKQLRDFRDIAGALINFIGQFENELVRIWKKPKFARNANYVITIDKLSESMLEKISKHPGMEKQEREWQELRLTGKNFNLPTSLKKFVLKQKEEKKDPDHRFLPIDTRHFKDLESDILACLGNLNEALDGELVQSENWQALNALGKKYEEAAKCIYIDPPYNTQNDESFGYKDLFQTSAWLTMMDNRIEMLSKILNNKGYFYMQLDHYADYLGRILMQRSFPKVGPGDQTVITWNTGENISGFKTQKNDWIRQADKILCFPKNPENKEFVKMWSPMKGKENQRIGWLDFLGDNKHSLYVEQWKNGKLTQKKADADAKRIGTVWNDIYSFQYSGTGATESFSFKTQKPENLLRRIIQSCTKKEDLVVDCFGGTGTTAAVAQKLGRKWMVVEQGEHFNNFYRDSDGKKQAGILGRMKIVLSGDMGFSLPKDSRQQKPRLTKDLNWRGGGAFAYYSLEQYEDTLRNMRYSNESRLLDSDPSRTPFAQYVFMSDDKFSHIVQVKGQGKDSTLRINLDALYKDIALPETIANLCGSPLQIKGHEFFTLANGEKFRTNPAQMNKEEKARLIEILKPCLWWGE